MPTYNFKQEAQVYVVSGGNRYRINVTDVSFSQTFSEQSYPVNTIHAPNNLFEGSVINKANEANFSFSFPASIEPNNSIVETLLLNASSFDLYIKTEADIFRIETAVITNGSFVIERSRPLSIEVQGEGSRLTRGSTLTGTLQSYSTVAKSFIVPALDITVNGLSLSSVVGVTIELQNEIEWTPYTTVGGAIAATSAATSMFPSTFTLSKKILAGSITQYLTDSNTGNAQNWDTDAFITIKAGNGATGANFRGFSFGPATCSFTNRINAGPSVYLQSYDWRMTLNPSNLATILKYETD